MHDTSLILTIAAGFTAAWLLGLLAQRLRLSPIIGYLVAGVILGPHTPGFVGDVHLAPQLAEIGVILLMFGVGLHFHLHDLLMVKGIAIPGALGQSLIATVCSMPLFAALGLDLRTGAVLGMAMAVASTVMLIRVLTDAEALDSHPGHVAVGWLLVEDLMTVLVLVLIPILGQTATEAVATESPAMAIVAVLLKLAALITVVLIAGARIVPWVLLQVARLRSRELFTLTVLVFSISVAAGAYVVFGASMALGAFLAGMVVAQSKVSHQAAADALPLRDAFAVLFFVSVGMLFDPMSLFREPLMMLAALSIIFLAKPLAALVIVAVLGQSVRTALTVALGLAQIGEFSFILSEAARRFGLMGEAQHNVLVGAAIISLALNPFIFRSLDGIERRLQAHPRLWKLLNFRAERKAARINTALREELSHLDRTARLAVLVGFGPVGRTVDRLLREQGLTTTIIELNLDTVLELQGQGQKAVFGDASQAAILESAGVKNASYLVLTLPQSSVRAAIVSAAKSLNPKLKVLVRAHYLRERDELEQAGATAAIYEEAEAAVALARLVLMDTGASARSIESTVRDIRMRLILENVSGLGQQHVRDIMVPWTRVRRLTYGMPLDEIRDIVATNVHSRWPIVDPNTGAAIGYMLTTDLIGLKQNHIVWEDFLRPLNAAAPGDDLEATLLRFQRESAAIYVVKDRQSPVGIITIEDILEQVVGKIQTEYREPQRVFLRDVIVTDAPLLELASQTSEQAIAEIVDKIPAGHLPPGIDVTQLAIEREREMPTNIGGGVAIPHARCPGLPSPLVIFARSPKGVVFNAQSPDLVDLIFLLITPAERVDDQIRLLSDIASLAGSPDNRQRLREARTPGHVLEIIQIPNEQREVSTGTSTVDAPVILPRFE